jgi:DNA invertase Pin-like site-specific DNA recombinase
MAATELAVPRSQRDDVRTALVEKYDDGGHTGANVDRPVLKKVLQDARDGLVDCVLVYKVDRLTRSLLDSLPIIEVLDQHGVSFVSVTQQFNTTSSLGRLTLTSCSRSRSSNARWSPVRAERGRCSHWPDAVAHLGQPGTAM